MSAPIVLLICYATFFLFAMVLPTVRVLRMTGINPVVLAAADDAAGFVGRMFKLVLGMLAVYLAALSLGWASQLGPFAVPYREARTAVGLVLVAASLVWVVMAQWQMGRSWRVGIDDTHPGQFVAGGLFRISRNPIFLGMMALLLGLFVVMPDALTMLVLVLGFTLISVQIRLEEAHLARRYGSAYEEYRAKVRRWL